MALMRVHWILVIVLTLLSMGLLVIIMGQHEVINRLNEASEKLRLESERLGNQYEKEDILKVSMENLVAQGKKAIEGLEDTVVKEGFEEEKKKAEFDACEAEKKTKTDGLAGLQKEHNETEATSKAESEAWNQEITTLKAQMVGPRPICDHVKKDPLVVKLCGNTTS